MGSILGSGVNVGKSELLCAKKALTIWGNSAPVVTTVEKACSCCRAPGCRNGAMVRSRWRRVKASPSLVAVVVALPWAEEGPLQVRLEE